MPEGLAEFFVDLGWAAGAVGAAVVATGYRLRSNASYLKTTGVRTTGVITESLKGKLLWWPTFTSLVRFTSSEGDETIVESKQTTRSAAPFESGTPVLVFYDPANPQRAIVESDAETHAWRLLRNGALLVVAGVILVITGVVS